jgi:phospholipid/cholesterol/gamma-HCH transport system substrate-binding protein
MLRAAATRLFSRSGREPGRPFIVVLGILGIAFGVLMVYISFEAPNAIPGRSYFNLYAKFQNADNIAPHAEVRLDGDLVGQVLNPHVEHGLGVVQLQLNPTIRPLLRSGTRVIVRPRSLVGVRYVEIVPGHGSQQLRNGSAVPSSHTGSTVALDQVLSTFDPTTRARTQTFLNELGLGVAGRGQDISDALGRAPRFLNDTQAVTGAIAAHPNAVPSLIDGSAAAATAVDPVRELLASGFAPEASALDPFWQHASSVQDTLSVAPAALTAVQSGLAQTDPLLQQLDGLANNIRPGLDAAPAALRQTSDLLQEAKQPLATAASTLHTTGHAVNPTLNLLSVLQPVLPDLDSVLSHGLPLTDQLGAYNCNVKELGNNWGSMMAFGNQGGGYLRLNLVGASQLSPYGLGSAAQTNIGVFKNGYPAPCQAGNETLPGLHR